MYRKLQADRIRETTAKLRQRITERFPNSGLSKVAGELEMVAGEACERATDFHKPNYYLRVVGVLLAALMVQVLVLIVMHLKRPTGAMDLPDFIQALEAFLGAVVFIGAAIIFLVTLEARFVRNRVLEALHELRALAHVVDMHQLTKDPERTVFPARSFTAASPKATLSPFELNRYLDYCAEMLSLTSKVGVLYAQGSNDTTVLAEVDALESLTTGQCRKIWQKLIILDQLVSRQHQLAATLSGEPGPT